MSIRGHFIGGLGLLLCLGAAGARAGEPMPASYSPPPASDYPPDAEPGACYSKVVVPEVTETVTEQVLAVPARTTPRVIPGVCRFEERTEVVRPPSVETVTVPATYRSVVETVVVRPAGVRTEVRPPVYDLVTEQVMVRQGYTVWRRSQARGGFDAGVPPYAGNGAPVTEVMPTGEVLCLVQVPPEYRAVTRQVLRRPAETVEFPYPAETALVTRQVIDTPAHEERRDIPAETRIVKARMCEPDQTVMDTLPPVFRMVPRTRVVSPARFEWRRITCKAPEPAPLPPPPPIHHRRRATFDCGCHGRPHRRPAPPPAPAPCAVSCAGHAAPSAPPQAQSGFHGDRSVARLQEALTARGYYKGPVDGLFSSETVQAMTRFQHDRNLPEGRYTGQTAAALGLTP